MRTLVFLILALCLTSDLLAEPLPVEGGWHTFCLGGPGSPATTENCFVNEGVGLVGNPMTFSSTSELELQITDAFIAGESFLVVVNGEEFTTPSVPIFGATDVFNPDLAFADPRYSSGSWVLPAGDYTVEVFALTTVGASGGAAYIQVILGPTIFMNGFE
jgi:hypothetical protein